MNHNSAFDLAWSLLKNDKPDMYENHNRELLAWLANQNDSPYPQMSLSAEEKEYKKHEEIAYELARQAIPRPYNMSQEDYENHIGELGDAILAERMGENKEGKKFQTTFDNDGSINRDSLKTVERIQNARMNHETKRRDAVPSQIETYPAEINNVLDLFLNGSNRNFSLVNNEGEIISNITGEGGVENRALQNFYGQTIAPYRRQGMYKKLVQALIGAGIPIISDERNDKSDAFHRKFMENLPANIKGDHLTEDDGSHLQTLGYQRQNVPQFLDAQGERSGLNRVDYGSFPIVNREKQARNMDKTIEEDSAKIKQGYGHTPIAGNPMARNTAQLAFNPNFKNDNPLVFSGFYDDEEQPPSLL